MSENYKLGLVIRELPLTEANPNVRDPAIYTDNKVVFRQLVDPETGTLVATEIAVDDEPPARLDARVSRDRIAFNQTFV